MVDHIQGARRFPGGGVVTMIEKKILVCCGTGIATSVQVANKLQRLLRAVSYTHLRAHETN